MKKFFLVAFIFLDLLVIVAAVFFLYARFKMNRSPIPVVRPQMSPVATSTASVTAMPVTSSGAVNTPATPGASTAGGTHKILFSYRNSKAKKVMIRAEFIGWRAEPMQRKPNGVWEYTAVLEPGEYGYLYSVDDHPKLDPFNKHTKQVGKTTVSSKTVQAAPH